MLIIKTVKQMRSFSRNNTLAGKSIGFVPTMGALHAGHASLIRQARKDNDIVVVSIFVNPIQFGPKEDFKKYPKKIKEDAMLCKKESVDAIFYPRVKEIYPDDFKTHVHVLGLSDQLCGQFRPGHFRGVATIITKFLNIIHPDIMYLGQKDAQQGVIIKKKVSDLNFPVKIKLMPIIREKTGLALSSRNQYLSLHQRQEALVLFQALNLARGLIRKGEKDTKKIIFRMKQLIKKNKSTKIDYVSIVDLNNLKPLKKATKNCLVALAVWIGKTRLIDNVIIK